jgi:hypothetical protein
MESTRSRVRERERDKEIERGIGMLATIYRREKKHI